MRCVIRATCSLCDVQVIFFISFLVFLLKVFIGFGLIWNNLQIDWANRSNTSLVDFYLGVVNGIKYVMVSCGFFRIWVYLN